MTAIGLEIATWVFDSAAVICRLSAPALFTATQHFGRFRPMLSKKASISIVVSLDAAFDGRRHGCAAALRW
jgi:hypothetical protein